MASKDSYCDPIFLSELTAGAHSEPLARQRFSKKAKHAADYDERWLQELILMRPGLLPVSQIVSGFEPLLPVCRELPIDQRALDVLLATPDGNLVLVECKLWRNPEARREVVTQILEYARGMSGWSYEDLEKAIGRAIIADGEAGKAQPKLFELAGAGGLMDESAFHDAVSRNLRSGRFLLLIVGDGIRDGVESMAEFLQQHAGFHFTLAFVEFAVYKARDGFIVQPRVPAKTVEIKRGIVSVVGNRIVVGPPPESATGEAYAPKRTSITEEQYLEELEKSCPGVLSNLDAFLRSLEDCDIEREFGSATMILRWRPDEGKTWNLGTIPRNGDVWLEHLGHQAQSADLLPLHKRYLEKLASLVPGAFVKETPKEAAWFVSYQGKAIKVDALIKDQTRRDGWVQAIQEFQAAVMQQTSDYAERG